MNDVLRNALGYLAKAQHASGGFVSYSSSQKSHFKAVHNYRTTFVPALMLSALCAVNTDGANAVKERLAAYLFEQKSPQWSFNYWQRTSREAKKLPYPDDLDDTFCALSALWRYDNKLIDESALAHIVKLLIATETAAGGPYKTWLTPADAPAAWHDIDLAVNANVAYFLRIALEPLPNLSSFLEDAITSSAFNSPYYPHEYPVIYYISRAYDGPKKGQLSEHILTMQHSDGSWGSPLKTALASSALHNLGATVPESAKQALLAAQQPDGSWPAEAFCIDPARDGVTFYHGSPALSTALVLEALFSKPDEPVSLATPRSTTTPLLKKMESRAKAMLTRLPAEPRTKAAQLIERTVRGRNGKEIILLPQHVYQSLQSKPPISEEVFTNLAEANLCGWVAYTIYDDFIDDEGDVQLLTTATIMMRRSMQAFLQAAPNEPAWKNFVEHTFDTMDAANSWELANCRFVSTTEEITIGTLPSYGRLNRLAERSAGHTLAPMGVLAAAGVLPDDPNAQYLYKALHHYLIARQLNDDAHDWQDDLRAGRVTYVVTELLRSREIHAGHYQLNSLIAESEPQFWHTTLPAVCRKILYHTQKSQTLLTQSQLLLPNNVIEGLVNGLQTIAREAQRSVDQTERFLQAYGLDDHGS